MINHKYAIETKFYDNGKIEIGEIETVGFEQESRVKSKEKFDIYYTVFNTKKEAAEYRQECINEKYGE